jgi:hypothetical protein
MTNSGNLNLIDGAQNIGTATWQFKTGQAGMALSMAHGSPRTILQSWILLKERQHSTLAKL